MSTQQLEKLLLAMYWTVEGEAKGKIGNRWFNSNIYVYKTTRFMDSKTFQDNQQTQLNIQTIHKIQQNRSTNRNITIRTRIHSKRWKWTNHLNQLIHKTQLKDM